MNFRSEFTPSNFSEKIKLTDKLLLIGSCFTEQIGKKLAAHKLNVLENPNGILFNPISIAKSAISYVDGKIYTEDELFYYNELWASKQHHTRFSHPDKKTALQKINSEQRAAVEFIKSADWVLLTLGSAFVYQWADMDDTEIYGNVAANCHKVPTDKFNKRLLVAEEIVAMLNQMQQRILQINASVKFIYTISPVRHLREGFIENNRSKAALITAVNELVNNSNVFYFPAYELVIDDLRDYRFFAEDLIHPNYAATNYVWEKFITAVIDADAQVFMKYINEINAAMKHKPFNESSTAHKIFKQKYYEKVLQLQKQYAFINFENELNFFN